jgi:hypothetical protein
MPRRKQEPGRNVPLARTGGLDRGGALERRSGLRPVSARRARENRQRRKMIRALYPERPLCVVPWCFQWADDGHEPLTRARGGSITDPGNVVPVCRRHNEELTLEPSWGYELGLLVHSWDAPARGSEAA